MVRSLFLALRPQNVVQNITSNLGCVSTGDGFVAVTCTQQSNLTKAAVVTSFANSSCSGASTTIGIPAGDCTGIGSRFARVWCAENEVGKGQGGRETRNQETHRAAVTGDGNWQCDEFNTCRLTCPGSNVGYASIVGGEYTCAGSACAVNCGETVYDCPLERATEYWACGDNGTLLSCKYSDHVCGSQCADMLTDTEVRAAADLSRLLSQVGHDGCMMGDSS